MRETGHMGPVSRARGMRGEAMSRRWFMAAWLAVALAGFCGGCGKDPTFADDYERGKFLQEHGRFRQVLAAFHDYDLMWPDSKLRPMVFLRIGECHEALAENDKALAAYTMAIALDPENVGVYAYENKTKLRQRLGQAGGKGK